MCCVFICFLDAPCWFLKAFPAGLAGINPMDVWKTSKRFRKHCKRPMWKKTWNIHIILVLFALWCSLQIKCVKVLVKCQICSFFSLSLSNSGSWRRSLPAAQAGVPLRPLSHPGGRAHHGGRVQDLQGLCPGALWEPDLQTWSLPGDAGASKQVP